MPPPDVPLDPSSSLTLDHAHILLTSFNSFLTIAIHNILYYRNIYPPSTFLSTKAYNLPVHQNRHPKVCAWIRDAVDAVAMQLSAGHVSRVAVVIHAPFDSSLLPQQPRRPSPSSSPSYGDDTSSATPSQDRKTPAIQPGAVLERWLFDTSRFPRWPTPSNPDPNPSPKATSKAMRDFARIITRDARSEDARERHLGPPGAEEDGDGAGSAATGKALRWPDLDEQLRGALRRMATTAEGMGPLPVAEGACTFTVAVEMKEGEGVRAPIGHPQAWIPSEPNLQPANSSRKGGRETTGEDLGGVRTRPIRAVEAGPLFFECWVEEGRAKEVLMKVAEESRSQGT
ncbi:hypothetical protein VTI74DRAFT_438 [Chaetomium olivicolor]